MSQLERLESSATSAGAEGGHDEEAEERPAGVADGRSSQQSLSLIRALHTNADVVACQVSLAPTLTLRSGPTPTQAALALSCVFPTSH